MSLLEQLGTVAFDLEVMRGLIGVGWIAQREDGMCRIVRMRELEDLREEASRFPGGAASRERQEVQRQIGGILRGRAELHVGPWLSVVPDVYRPIGESACLRVATRWINRAVGEREEAKIVQEIREECLRTIESDRADFQ